MTLLGF
jgi:hypothetical protein